MSASLVGSEMCIRDSCHAGPCLRRAEVRLLAACQWCFAKNSSAADAVSYTHLTLPTICSV
eukprot:11094729-Alexandrium_andersonii.AAC.1